MNVSKAMGDPSRVQARGPGLQLAGNVANKPTYFDIYTAGTHESSSASFVTLGLHLSDEKGLLSIRLSSRGRRRRRGRRGGGLERPEGHGGDCAGEQRGQYFSLHLRTCPGGTSHRLRVLCQAPDSQKPFHRPHLRG